MIEPPPPRPGEPLRASWAQRLVTYVRSLRVIAGPGLVGRRTSAGTVLSLAPSAPAAKPRNVRPKLFECRTMDVDGTPHLACYCPDEYWGAAVTLGAGYSKPLDSQRLAADRSWIDLGAMPSDGYGVYVGFEDLGPNESPRWGWRLCVTNGPIGIPGAILAHFPYIPIAFVGSAGTINQYHTGAIVITEPWFYPLENDLFVGLRLKGTNGNVLAVFSDTDSSSGAISADFRGNLSSAGDATVGGDLTLGGKLTIGNQSYKPAWRTITIDGVPYTVLAQAQTRP